MWPFTRKLPPAASKGPAAMPAPMMRDDWKFQPPVQRAIGQHPLTAPSDEFARQLATHQDPSVVSRTLGHHVSMDGPAGLVLAIATPGRRQDGPAMVSRPRVQRRAATIDATDLEFPEEAQDAAVSQPLPGPPSRELPILPGPPEVQRLTRIAPGAEPVPIGPGRSVRSEPIEIQRSTPAASDDELTGPAPAMMDDAQAAIPSRRTLGQSRRLGLGAPLAQVPVTSVQRATELALATPRREPAASPSQTVGELSQATPLGLMDLKERPDEGHSVASGPMPAEASLKASAQRAEAMPLALPITPHQEAPHERQAATPMMDDAAGPDTAESPAEMQLQRLELPLRPATAAAAATAAASPAHAAAEGETTRTDPDSKAAGVAVGLAASLSEPIQRAIVPGGTGPGNVSPRTVDLPLLQRRVASGTPASSLIAPDASLRHEASMGTPVELESKAADWPVDALAQPVASRPAGERTSATAPVTPGQAPLAGSRALGTLVQRAAPRGDVQVVTGTTAAGIAGVHEVDSPLSAAARLYRSPDPGAVSTPFVTADHTPAGTFSAHRGSILQRVAAEPRATQASPLTLAQASTLSSPSSLPPASHSSPLSLPLAPVATMAALQRATASAQALQSDPVSPAIALQPAAAEPALPDRQETFFAQREVSSGSSAGAPSTQGAAAAAEPAAHDEAMDALAGKLYDRIRSRLKSELLVDRERAGLLTDLR